MLIKIVVFKTLTFLNLSQNSFFYYLFFYINHIHQFLLILWVFILRVMLHASKFIINLKLKFNNFNIYIISLLYNGRASGLVRRTSAIGSVEQKRAQLLNFYSPKLCKVLVLFETIQIHFFFIAYYCEVQWAQWLSSIKSTGFFKDCITWFWKCYSHRINNSMIIKPVQCVKSEQWF